MTLTTLPIVSDSWTTSFNNRYTYVSLAGAVGAVMFDLTTKLIAAGYVCKGSASAGTGLMDGTNRWTSAAAVTPRATTTGASQAWMVLTDGLGIDILLTYQGSTDDKFKISFSASGVFVAAGTPNQQPTATDEVITQANTVSLVATTTSGDRVWHIWISSDHKSFRCAIGTASTLFCAFGQEKVSSAVLLPCVFSPPSFGWAVSGVSSFTFSNTNLSFSPKGFAVVRGISTLTASIFFGTEPNSSSNAYTSAVQALQGSVYPLQQVFLLSATTNASGKLGTAIDWWIAKTTGSEDGEQPGGPGFVQVGGYIWPGDSVTTLVFV